MKRHLVTGATGFVGGALVLELMRQPDAEVWGLVRAPDDGAARGRLLASLEAAARAYGCPELVPELDRRCRAVAGDIQRSLEELPGRLPALDEVWHSAASLKYLEREAAEVRSSNVEGTRRVAQLAVAVGAGTFNHVSTAYVAGKREGTILEELQAPDTVTNNVYERTKLEAELVVASLPLRVRILRPGVVVGHSRTLAVFGSFGLYGAERHMLTFRRKVRDKLGSYMSHYRAQLLGDPEVPLNFVPVDQVARNAVRISLSDSPEMVFHLTNECTTSVADAAAACFNVLGMRDPELVPNDDTLTSLDRVLSRELDFHLAYMKYSKIFDRAHTDAVCGEPASRHPVDRDLVAALLLRWLEDHDDERAAARTAVG